MSTVFRSPGVRRHVLAAIASTGGLLFGFDTGIISGALPLIQQDWRLDTFTSSLLVAALLGGAVVGALIAGQVCDRLGRREIITATSATFALGAFGSGLAPSIDWLIASRAVVGLALGAISVSVPLHIAEIAPAKSRGALVSCNQLAITIGILLAYVTAALLGSDHEAWRHMFMAGSALAVLLGITSVALLESPRWLVWQDDEQEARRVLGELIAQPQDIDREIDRIKRGLKAETENRLGKLIRGRGRPEMITGIGLYFFQQFVGINAILYFAPSIFTKAGFDGQTAALLATVAIGVLNVLMTVLAMRLLDRVGRRPLLSIGFSGMALSLLAAGLTFMVFGEASGAQRWLVLLALLTFIACFAVSIGPIGWLMISEIYPTTLRGRAMSIPSAAHWLFNAVVSFSFLPLLLHLGDGPTFGLFALFGMAGWFFCRFLVPETKGLALEEIQEQQAARAAARPPT
ncbi:MAG: sugar porter family MFS transporter [Alphaproteobacteria bacterium]|nr:sugar porter family MFS transporter [Alphaproteobacteria bacterium]